MIRLLTAVLLFASFDVVAQTQVPNVFEDGTPASAAEVNANFDALETAIDAIPEGPAGPQGEKGDKGDTGATGANGSDGFSTYQTVEGLGPGLSCGEGGSLFRSWLDVNSNGVFDFGTDSNYIESTVCNGVSGTNGTNGADDADGVAAGLSCATDQIIRWSGSAWVCVTEPITAYWVTKNYRSEFETQIEHNLERVSCSVPSSTSDLGDCFFEVSGVADHTRCATQVSDQYFRATVTTYPSAVEVRELRELEEIHVTITCLP